MHGTWRADTATNLPFDPAVLSSCWLGVLPAKFKGLRLTHALRKGQIGLSRVKCHCGEPRTERQMT
jgi:hypothetical protein